MLTERWGQVQWRRHSTMLFSVEKNFKWIRILFYLKETWFAWLLYFKRISICLQKFSVTIYKTAAKKSTLTCFCYHRSSVLFSLQQPAASSYMPASTFDFSVGRILIPNSLKWRIFSQQDDHQGRGGGGSLKWPIQPRRALSLRNFNFCPSESKLLCTESGPRARIPQVAAGPLACAGRSLCADGHVERILLRHGANTRRRVICSTPQRAAAWDSLRAIHLWKHLKSLKSIHPAMQISHSLR